MVPAVTTRTGMAMTKAAQALSPSIWWDKQAGPFLASGGGTAPAGI